MLPHIFLASLVSEAIWIDIVIFWTLEAIFAEKFIHSSIGEVVFVVPIFFALGKANGDLRNILHGCLTKLTW